ncbi:hypothetical protein [Porphyrobacter sp. AAP60]|uniref:hypothetical protein n=1 Tax=Porphyrobacter sp. AAP60 TaxID=1523423 RepID=UPI0006B97D0D|nr:hypothetical protein [Porphyrobacter sp. AAP60]
MTHRKYIFGSSNLSGAIGLLALCFAAPLLGQSLALEAAEDVAEVAEAPAELPEVKAGEVPDGSVGGMGDINIYPRRIVMDQRQRVASVGLYNKMPFEGEYEISVANMIMTDRGQIIPFSNLPANVDASEVKTASDMLRWSPRRVLLLGSEAQTVRIMARPPADLPDGEYRAHFTVVSVPSDINDGFSIDDALGGGNQAAGNVGVTIRPRFGISIPVIVRVGSTTLEVGLADFSISPGDGGPQVSLTISRSGTRSAYGDLIITAPGQEAPLVVARGIGVYPEIDARKVQLAINPEFDISKLTSGMTVTATFVDDDVAPGDTLAKQTFVVP